MAQIEHVSQLEKIVPDAEECADECVIDTEALKARLAQRESANGDDGDGILILLTQGNYGRYDDVFSAIQVGNAVLAVELPATLLLLDDGVYFGVKNQDPRELGLRSNLFYIQDFLDLGGRMLALDSSMQRRSLAPEDLVDGVQVIDAAQMTREVDHHRATVTF